MESRLPIDASSVGRVAREIINTPGMSDAYVEVARAAMLLIGYARNLEDKLRCHPSPPMSVKEFVERHLSCDWDVRPDVTCARMWKCRMCER